jgi:hypothetical protein
MPFEGEIMKKWLFIVVMVFCSCALNASEAEREEYLSAKVILQNKTGYYVLTDGSCWKVIGFEKRWRTPREWWNNVQLVPRNYECIPNDWFLGAKIQAYPKYEYLNVDEANASNEAELKQCTHLLLNTRTGQVLFAIALHASDCMVQVYTSSRDEGYHQGYTEGKLSSYQNANDIFNRGVSEGYKNGYSKGYQDAVNGETAN